MGGVLAELAGLKLAAGLAVCGKRGEAEIGQTAIAHDDDGCSQCGSDYPTLAGIRLHGRSLTADDSRLISRDRFARQEVVAATMKQVGLGMDSVRPHRNGGWWSAGWQSSSRWGASDWS